MNGLEIESQFRETMICEASRDDRLRGAMKWLILGDPALVPKELLGTEDLTSLADDLQEHYGLDGYSILQAMELCERAVEREVNYE